jgi:uncharacterized protein YndB with AHSA1/START domain
MKSVATSRITPDGDAIICEIHIASPPERVFRALVDPKLVVQWWGEPGIYRCTEFQADLRVGGKWKSAGLDGSGHRFEVVGEYLEIDRPRLLVSSWTATWTGDVKTTIRWELESTGGGTLVRIQHSGLAAHPELAQSYRGWPRMLEWLRAFVDDGETVDGRKPPSPG